MLGWIGDIEQETLGNTTFRTVVFTGDDIGREVHPEHDQFLRIEGGTARVELSHSEDAVEEAHDVEADWAIIVRAGVWHNVVNTGTEALKVYSLYSPPEHPDGTVHRTKADAMAAEHHS
jgi:mannose-6-phosphate isomerase-like protein (cupin superfamily)